MTNTVAPSLSTTSPSLRPATETGLVAGLVVLSVSTGILDAVSYLALDQVFTGNMTGNVLFLGFALAGLEKLPVLNLLVALLAFFAGAVVAASVLRLARSQGRFPRATMFMLIGGTVLTVGVGATWALTGTLSELGLVIATGVLAFALGAQSSSLKPVGIKDISTVVVTMTMVNLAGDGWLAGKKDPHWLRKLLAIAAMGTGAFIGAFLVLHFGGAVATFAAGAVMILGIVVLSVAAKR